MDAVQFDVAYEFGEYRLFAIEHGSHATGKQFGFFGRAFLSFIALPVYLYKVSRVGRCLFTIDAAGIVRVSSVGKLTIPWAAVTAVRRYTPGLLIEKREGAVPIPYRCLTPSQRASVETLVKNWEAENEKKSDV